MLRSSRGWPSTQCPFSEILSKPSAPNGWDRLKPILQTFRHRLFLRRPQISPSWLCFCHNLTRKSLSLLSLTCFPSSSEMPRSWVLLPLGPSLLAQPPCLPTPQPPGATPPFVNGGVRAPGRVTGIHSCLSSRHPLSSLDVNQPQAASR